MKMSNKQVAVLVSLAILLFTVTSVAAEITQSPSQTSGGDQTDDLKSSKLDLPTTFSWGDYDGHNLMTSVKNMGTCGTGSCAMSIVSMYEARYRIQTYLSSSSIPDIDLSEQYIVSCVNGSCDGCSMTEFLDSLEGSGVPDEDCFPYIAIATPCAPCVDIDERMYRASQSGFVTGLSGLSGVETMMTEIYSHGPIVATMDVYEDFYSYAGGIYIQPSTAYLGNIPVVLYGWGIDGADHYWLAKNKWGNYWGEVGPDGLGGWFRIRKGTNECGIENYYWHVTPINPELESCCGLYTGGQTGNTNCDVDGKRNLADISKLIDRVYITKVALCCEENGNVNGDVEGRINLADISKLIDHVYISKTETAACL